MRTISLFGDFNAEVETPKENSTYLFLALTDGGRTGFRVPLDSYQARNLATALTEAAAEKDAASRRA